MNGPYKFRVSDDLLFYERCAHTMCVLEDTKTWTWGFRDMPKTSGPFASQMKESGTSKLNVHDGLAYTLDMHTPGLHSKRFILFVCLHPFSFTEMFAL